MGKILAIVFLVVFAWYAIPLLGQGIWIAPTMYPTSWWGEPVYEYDQQVVQEGYGWFSFDPRTNTHDSGRTTANVFNSL